jgi:hypothetical protein
MKILEECNTGLFYRRTVGPPNNENIGAANFFHYSEVFFIERYVYIMVKPVGTWE